MPALLLVFEVDIFDAVNIYIGVRVPTEREHSAVLVPTCVPTTNGVIMRVFPVFPVFPPENTL